jgi:hypothetical protein
MGVNVGIQRVALMEQQVIDWDLPPAPTKSGDSRAANWDGIGQVELDAVRPAQIRELLEDALRDVMDMDLYAELEEQEEQEQEEFKASLKADFATLLD